MQNERTIRSVIGPENENVRLDLYLAGRFTYHSRTAWQETIRAGKIRINGHPARSSRPLHENDVVEFFPDERELAEPEVDPAWSVLLETADFIAVNKSGNLPVHPSGRYFHHTLLALLEPTFGRLYPVNRLDRETSGVILFAKTPSAAGHLAGLFEQNAIHKTYIALVFGRFPDHLTAAGWLGPDLRSPVNKKRIFSPDPLPAADAQTAKTEFHCLDSNGLYSAVECHPSTGRLHQLRATLCSLGYPLLGDKLYGPDDTLYLRQVEGSLTPEDWQQLVLPRQALHASRLVFRSPFTGTDLSIKAPLPPDMSKVYNESTRNLTA